MTIVDIDERSLATLGQWPWSRVRCRRARRSACRRRRSEYRLRHDLLPSLIACRRSRIAGMLKIDGRRLRQPSSRRLPDSDELLVASDPSGSASFSVRRGSAESAVNREGADEQPHTSIATIGGDPRGELIRFPRLLRNLPELEVAAAGPGPVHRSTGAGRCHSSRADDAVQRGPNRSGAFDRAVAGRDRARTSLVVKSDEAGVKAVVVVGGVEIATDRDGQLWLHFGPHDPKRYRVGLRRSRAARSRRKRIEGKIVLIGTSAVGLFDLRSTPVERVMPGVEIHAQVDREHSRRVRCSCGRTTRSAPRSALPSLVGLGWSWRCRCSARCRR